jgi:hypothetical protein
MRGTFENPPIILQQDRIKLGLSLVIAAGGALLFAFRLSADAGRSVALDSFLLLLFGVLSLYLIYALYRPGHLILEPSELTWYTGIRTFRCSWNDFMSFAIYSPRIFSRQPGCVYADGSQRNKMLRGLMGATDSFGPCWKESSQEIVDLLNKARERLGSSN